MTANERLLEESIRHAVYFSRYSNGVVRRFIALLNRVDADLFAQLAVALEGITEDRLERLESVLFSVRTLNIQAYREAGLLLRAELRDLAAYEASYQAQMIEGLVPVRVHTVSPDTVYAAALGRPFQGRLLTEWSDSIEATRMTRIRDAIRIGITEGQTTGDIVRRVRGTRAKGYQDGIIEIDRRSAETIVRTALAHTAQVARTQFDEANLDLIKGFKWVSTLDGRTSKLCMVRDGKRYDTEYRPVGHSIPWLSGPGRLHFGCRSTSTRILKSWREMGIDLDEALAGTRASLDGQVPAEMTYGQWLKKQLADVQDDVLGPVRGKLFRQGGIEFDKFANDKGVWLDLDALRKRDAAAFKRAGLE